MAIPSNKMATLHRVDIRRIGPLDIKKWWRHRQFMFCFIGATKMVPAMALALAIAQAGATTPAMAQQTAYVLTHHMRGNNFLSHFELFSSPDPTHGFVQYVNEATAKNTNLVGVNSNNTFYIKADSTNITPQGRPSVRIVSKDKFTSGLFIADFAAMPEPVCGTWPAYWFVGPDWPNGGEIDVIEGVSEETNNAITLHTADGCMLKNSNEHFDGIVKTANCYINAPGQAVNQGCNVGMGDRRAYGKLFNAAGGGVYAVDWSQDQIRVWFFSREDQIPQDILDGTPDPSSWGKPNLFVDNSTCNIQRYFRDLQIVINLTFCGDWAGSVWQYDSSCQSKASTCSDFVANNPSAFKDAIWKINLIQVYQKKVF